MVYSLDGELLAETTVDLIPGKQEDDTIAVRVDGPSSSLTILERGVHVPERGFFRLQGAADDPHVPIVLRGHEDEITIVVTSPDNHWLVAASGDPFGDTADNTARLE